MIYRKQDDIHWLEFELLANEGLKHGVFLKNGDLDFRNSVAKNSVMQALQITSVSSSKQCHGKEVAYFADDKIIPFCDALVTDVPGLGLIICHADCQSAIFYDPIHRILANVHSGWRGSVQNIYAETAQYMKNKFNTKPEDLLVAISPSLGPENAQFINYKQELPESFWEFQVKPYYFDFWAISRLQLQQVGILPHHIQLAEMDTFSDTDKFFSYRRDKTPSRNGTVVSL